MNKLIIVIILFYITICYSIITPEQQQQQQQKNIEFKNEDKTINEIINKNYKKLVTKLKLNNKYHNNESHYLKKAMEKPLTHKCDHEEFQKKQKQQLNLNNIVNQQQQQQQQPIDDIIEQIEETTAVVNASAPIRFGYNTDLLTNDPYACYTVGSTITLGGLKGSTTLPCKDDGSVDPCVYTCKAADIISADLKTLITDYILVTLNEIFASKLKVINPQSILKWDTNYPYSCSYGVNVPDSIYTTGYSNIDIFVFVTARPKPDSQAVASAGSCNSNYSKGKFGRSLGATINFNPSYFTQFIGNENSFQFNTYARFGVHEMMHALGFSSNLFSSFVSPNTQNVIRNGLGASSTVTLTGVSPSNVQWSISKFGIYSNNVLSFARDHYGCPTMQYVELEDYGGKGTAGSHWEQRSTGEEIMIGFVTATAPITDLSFALLQDSGWYEVIPDGADQLIFGKSLGCNFVQQMCSPTNWDYPGYFCSISDLANKNRCSATRMGKGTCSLYIASTPPQPGYQHFTNSSIVGPYESADCCPSVLSVDQYCFDSSLQSTANSNIFENYCDDCKCFEYQDPVNSALVKQACWEQRCNNQTLQININNSWVNCPDSQKIISNGITILCPKSYTICNPITFTPSLPTNSTSSSSSSSETINNSNLISPPYYLLVVLSLLLISIIIIL